MWYLLLTAVTFYLVAFVLPVPSVGPVSSEYVRSLLYVAVHLMTHAALRR
jgi:hypothetical protein